MQRQLPPLEQFRRELLEDSEFRALKLGSWLGTTDGKLIAEAVSMVIPPVYAPAYQLAVKGLTMAAQEQAAEGRKTAGAIALGSLLIGGGALALAAGESA
jgi:predicted RNA methylase